MKKSFLSLVARAFIEDSELSKMLFVLPNRRSCTFLRNEMHMAARQSMIMPSIVTISDFVAEQSNLVEADRIELLFALFNVYKSLKGTQDVTFERFLYWGDTILNDFNDIDMYLIDSNEVLKNLVDYKEINTNPLTEKQCEVIRRYWGEERTPGGDEGLFEKSEKYRVLWSKLPELYEKFRSALLRRGIGYPGLIYRNAAEQIKNRKDFGYEQIVFVGFSTLSAAEKSIFEGLKEIGDYYWDCNGPVFEDTDNLASFFTGDYIKVFPSKRDLGEEPITKLPNINVISVPSGSGQAKVVGKILNELYPKGKEYNNLVEAAVVLPEEKHLYSMLYSVPEQITAINVTMGFPIKQSSSATFFNTLNSMLKRSRVVDNETCYFYEDLNSLLSHPFIATNRKFVAAVQSKITEGRLYFVPTSVICEHSDNFTPIFEYRADIDGYEYLKGVLGAIVGSEGLSQIDSYFLEIYNNAILRIKQLTEKEHIVTQGLQYLYLTNRLLSTVTVPFESEPLVGMQIMGVLETRLLDFKNLFILSMNEKVYPTKSYTASFIPQFMRRGYGMPTRLQQDAMQTYYFYRMLSRAENVYLIYDTRVQGRSSGEESRFIKQLERIYKDKCQSFQRSIYSFTLASRKKDQIVVTKTEDIQNKLKRYLASNGETPERCLSPSTIYKYLGCSLRFYLESVEGIKEPEEIDDFIDPATFGNVIHRTLQTAYEDAPQEKVSAQFLEGLKAGGIDNYIKQAIVSEYMQKDPTSYIIDDKTMTGDVSVILAAVHEMIIPMLEYEIQTFCQNGTVFEYVEGETKKMCTIPINAGNVNIEFIIDRLDRAGGTLRIVDYKSGNDEIALSNIDTAFCGDNNYKGIFQVLLYGHLYNLVEGRKDAIQPAIYKFRTMYPEPGKSFGLYRKGKIKDVKLNPQVKDYHCVMADNVDDSAEFYNKFINTLNEIFNPNVPFKQTQNKNHCSFCPFKDLCAD
ncbi:MAG: PD-(D/E)XK nuclease family protein [Candidatus Limisoma sp.]